MISKLFVLKSAAVSLFAVSIAMSAGAQTNSFDCNLIAMSAQNLYDVIKERKKLIVSAPTLKARQTNRYNKSLPRYQERLAKERRKLGALKDARWTNFGLSLERRINAQEARIDYAKDKLKFFTEQYNQFMTTIDQLVVQYTEEMPAKEAELNKMVEDYHKCTAGVATPTV